MIQNHNHRTTEEFFSYFPSINSSYFLYQSSNLLPEQALGPVPVRYYRLATALTVWRIIIFALYQTYYHVTITWWSCDAGRWAWRRPCWAYPPLLAAACCLDPLVWTSGPEAWAASETRVGRQSPGWGSSGSSPLGPGWPWPRMSRSRRTGSLSSSSHLFLRRRQREAPIFQSLKHLPTKRKKFAS